MSIEQAKLDAVGGLLALSVSLSREGKDPTVLFKIAKKQLQTEATIGGRKRKLGNDNQRTREIVCLANTSLNNRVY